MRANSLTNLGIALDYNVASDYDKVLILSKIASEIEVLAPHANEIATLVANLPDVLTVQEASELVNNLTVRVTTLPAGSTATSELVGTEIRLGIPQGRQGPKGYDGLAPNIEFSIDGYGNLVYEVVGWLDINTGNTGNTLVEEWQWQKQ